MASNPHYENGSGHPKLGKCEIEGFHRPTVPEDDSEVDGTEESDDHNGALGLNSSPIAIK